MSPTIQTKPLFRDLATLSGAVSSGGGPVEVVEDAEFGGSDDACASANSTNSAYPPCLAPSWPADSVLEKFMAFARDYSESEDCILIGSILPVVARLLGRRVWIPFAGKKYPNLYNVLVTPPGFRKSTSINLAEQIGRALLPYDAFLEGATSEQALFKSFQATPDRLLIEDEGNTLLSNWSNDAAGKQVAKRFLRLYDCGSWTQSYIRQADENDGNASMRIDGTSTSMLVGTTYNNCRFNGLETRDGMRRRVNYYVSERMARVIYWPAECDGRAFSELVDSFKRLVQVEGAFQPLLGDTMNLWKELQEANREEIRSTLGVDAASEAYGSALAEESAKILKFAMIFQLCRWAVETVDNWQVIQPDILQIAADHGRYCLQASKRLDAIGRRAEIRDQADAILATIRVDYKLAASDGIIELTKSELTHKFAANPGRRGALTPSRLYNELLVDLQARGLAEIVKPRGKLHLYRIKADPEGAFSTASH